MRHTLYKRLVYWIDANQTWIEVVNDNLYKEQLIKGRGRTGYWVSRNLMLKAYRSNGAYKKGTIWIIPENDLDKALAAYRKKDHLFKQRIKTSPDSLTAKDTEVIIQMATYGLVRLELDKYSIFTIPEIYKL